MDPGSFNAGISYDFMVRVYVLVVMIVMLILMNGWANESIHWYSWIQRSPL